MPGESPPSEHALKILQLVSGTDVNGALVHCRLLARELAGRGHNVTIACRSRSWLWDQMHDTSVRMVPCGMKRWPLSDLTQFANWVRREKFDLMHTHMSSANLFGIIMKRLTGVPVIATAHSRHIQPHWRLNDHVIANSTVTEKYHRRFNRVGGDRISTVHCFVDAKKFCEPERIIYRGLRRQWRFHPNTRVIVLAGDVVPHKGHWYFFQCLPELLRRFDDLRVVVVGRFKRGETYTQKLRRYLLQQNILKRVKWIGRRNNMHEILAAADLVVIPSLVESLGMVALESMAVGTPVVASRTGGLVELIDDEKNGLLVPQKDPAAMTVAISRVFQDVELSEQMIAGGKHVVESKFSASVLTAEIESVFYRVRNRLESASRSSPDHRKSA